MILILVSLTVAQATQPQLEAKPAQVAHVIVALCDNEYQGIVPVKDSLGRGDDAANNLYWGAQYGVRSFFAKSRGWRRLADQHNLSETVLARLVLRFGTTDRFVVADAYRGRDIARAVSDFLRASAGDLATSVTVTDGAATHTLPLFGGAALVAYVGHDGLMDDWNPQIAALMQQLPERRPEVARGRDVIVLACASKQFFSGPLQRTGATPLLWTTGLFAPEAYVLEAALSVWVRGGDGAGMREAAAAAYNGFQHCGLKGAKNLFVSGW